MKALQAILPLALFLASMAVAEEPRRQGIGPEMLPEGPRAPTSDLPSDEDLNARREAAGAMAPKVVTRKPRGYSLEALSQFIGQGDYSTILPKGSVIHCPEALAARLLAKPQGHMMGWPEFLIANRTWITTHEVTQAQTVGEAPLSEADRSSFAAGGKIVIATLRGNPVTVLKPVPKISE